MDHVGGILLTAAETLFFGAVVEGVVGNGISKLAKRHPRDEKWLAQLKDMWRDGNETARIEKRENQLKVACDKFNDAMKLIANRTKNNENDKNNMFIIALRLLNNENMSKLAIVLFDNEWAKNISQKFDAAHDEFMWCGLDKEHVHFYYRLSALRLALFCDVYRKLMHDKSLKQLDVTIYLEPILAKLTKCIKNGEIEFYEEITNFACEILLFTEMQPKDLIEKLKEKERKNQNEIRERFKPDKEKKEKKAKKTEEKRKYKVLGKLVENTTPVSPKVQIIEKDIIVNWLSELSKCLFDSLQKPLKIYTMCPMLLAAYIINEIYIHKFKKYNPFYFDLGFQFDMNSWIPIKLVAENNRKDNDPFQLIENGLKRNANKVEVGSLVVITGDPGAGKTLLTHKIAYDYAKLKDNKWGEYDLVLLTEFRSTSDRKHETIIDMALHGLEKIGLKQNVINFIKENVNECKILVILDGYDEAVDGQCHQLDDILSSYGNENKLDFDLIVTRRPTAVINRKQNVTFLDIIGFDTEAKQEEYIEKHFENDTNRNEQIESVIKKITNNSSYQQMAETPLLLTFICLVHSQLKQGTRVELYENVIQWFIRRKLTASPNLLAELASKKSVFTGSKHEMTSYEIQDLIDNWFDLEQMQRLGYISLLYLQKEQYQFGHKELQLIQPNININVFIKIGLIISNTEVSNENQMKKYEFAHRTLQEYFAAMFIVKWENEWIRNGIKYEKVNELWMWEENAHIYSSDELSKFITEILLAKRESQYIQSAEQYLIKVKTISFEIHSNDIDESSKQIKYINNILQKCPNIKKVIIDLHKISVNNTIELHLLPNIYYIDVKILNGLFFNNRSNIISISSANAISIKIDECYLSLSGLILFAEYINNNAQRFNLIRFKNILLTEADMIDINKLKSIYFKQYCGDLWIENLQLDSTQSTEYLINLSILQLFFGIKQLYLELPRNDEMNDNSYLLQQSIEYSSDMTNLTELNLFYNDDNTSIGETYWTCINKIIQKCLNIRNIWIGSLLNNISIDEPIDLHFLSLKHHIELEIRNVIFTDNDSNMICINGKVQQINIRFINCQYSYLRLILFANYINQNSQLFNKIEFIDIYDKDISLFDSALMNTKFDHIAIKQNTSDKYSIVKR